MLGRSADEAYFEGFLWLTGVVAVVVLAVVILSFLRARVRRSKLSAQAPFSLAQLRRLRDQGELTCSEYEVLKRRVLDAHKGSTDAVR